MNPTPTRYSTSKIFPPAVGILPGSWMFFAIVALSCLLCNPARSENPEHILWGVMDWKNDQSFPDTDTSPTRPIYRDGNCRIITHQYQSPNWLAYKISSENVNEVSRIYANGNCIRLMLYFVNCTHDTSNNTFGYPLNDQFLADYTELLNAYKVGGGPLYIEAFPEFEEWYRSKPAAEQDQYREKIRAQFSAMVQITRANYNRAYIGMSFEGQSFVGDTSQFVARWDSAISKGDLVYINCMSAWPQYWDQAIEMVKGTKMIANNWALPIMFPFVELWADTNTPIFTTGDGNTYAEDAALFSNTIITWINSSLMAPAEIEGAQTADWRTNLRTLKSRGLFAFSLYSAHYCNKPTTPPDPDGFVHSLPSYTTLTNLMSSNSRTYLYPVTETEFWQAVNPPTASTSYGVEADSNCSSGNVVVLNSTSATGQHFTYRVPITHDGNYRVLIGIRKQSDGGWFNLYVDGSGTQLGSERNCSLASGVGNYQEYDQGVITVSGLTRTKFTDFKFAVTRAGNAGGYKLAIDYIKLVPEVPLTIPAAPTGLTATAVSNTRVDLAWAASATATGYNVKRATTSGGPYATIASNVAATTYADAGLVSGTTYYYVVTALNAAGESGNSAQASATPSSNLEFIKDNSDSTGIAITGSWTASSSSPGYYGASYLHDGNSAANGASVRFSPSLPATDVYAVYLRWTSDPNRAPNVPVDVTHAGGTTTFSVNQQINGGAWNYLGTFNFNAGSAGNVLVRNDNATGYVIADAVRFVQGGGAPPSPPAAPTNLTATGGKRKVTLTWTASPDAASYNIKRATVSGGPYATIATGVTATTYTNGGLNTGTTYYFVVSAVNANGESANSNQASATAN